MSGNQSLSIALPQSTNSTMTPQNTPPTPTIPEFFAGKTVLLTGGTGFIGKVLLEKILRCCPQVKTVYLLMRPKRGKSLEERVRQITELPLFGPLRQQDAAALKKVRLVEGDVSQAGLGLAEEDRAELVREVNVVFHAAASVRFDDPLVEAVLKNTRGTRDLCLLALQMRALTALVHISTTYCNTDRRVIEEELCPPHADWRSAIRIAETVDGRIVDVLTSKFMAPLPNTYTFTKSLAEHVVVDLCTGKIPTVIFRPSIVISSFKEPIPGWIDNFNGPVGLLVASGKGIVRSIYANPDIVADYVPVDIIVNALMIACWEKATLQSPQETLRVSFYNGSNNNVQPITTARIVEVGRMLAWSYPFNDILWYPDGSVTTCPHYHYLRVVFFQVLPAYMVDYLLQLAGRKPMLVKVQRKIYAANQALMYFIMNQWTFVNEKVKRLETLLLKSDVETFSFHRDEVDVVKYFKLASLGARKYLLHETDASMEAARRHSRRMWVLHQLLKVLVFLLFVWVLFCKANAAEYLFRKYNDMCEYLTAE